jgi:DNA gyrase subunit A
LAVTPEDDLMLITSGGMIVRIAAGSVRQISRKRQGVRVIDLTDGDTLAGVARIADEGKADPAGPEAPGAPGQPTHAGDGEPQA